MVRLRLPNWPQHSLSCDASVRNYPNQVGLYVCGGIVLIVYWFEKTHPELSGTISTLGPGLSEYR